MSKQKILISGCGITYQGNQNHRTWPQVLRTIGTDIIDVSGPAVSNQWILNKTFLSLLTNHDKIQTAVVQITSIGKLDVEINTDRVKELVAPDSLRNFVLYPDRTVNLISKDNTDAVAPGGIWPSSASQEHYAKKNWNKFLYSPMLEIEDLFCKLLMLNAYCHGKNINLLVFQGYDLPWRTDQIAHLRSVIKNLGSNLYQQYRDSTLYQYHDHAGHNSVPCFEYQVHIADMIAAHLDLDSIARNKLSNIVKIYEKS